MLDSVQGETSGANRDSLVRELDDAGAVLQGKLFLGSKYVQDVLRNVKQRLRGKGWLAGRKRTWPDKGG